MKNSRYRGGVTIVEFLVAVGIVAVLVALLLSGVQRVRESAARTACLNNLHQIGIALHAYHNANQVFPPGMTYESGAHPQPFLSWQARILPYLDRHDLWSQTEAAYQIDRDFLNIPPHSAALVRVPVFGCPSDARSKRLSQSGRAFTSYLGVEGLGTILRNGILHLDSRVSTAMITDGTSNTIVVAERPPSGDEQFGWWYAGWGQNRNGSAEMILGVQEFMLFAPYYTVCSFGPYHYRAGKVSNVCDAFHFWSLHPGGANFLFADGSIRFIKYSAADLMPALASRAGGEAIAGDF